MNKEDSLPPRDEKSQRYAEGLGLRTKVMGSEHVELALKQTSEFCRPVQELVTEYAWGEIPTGSFSTCPHPVAARL